MIRLALFGVSPLVLATAASAQPTPPPMDHGMHHDHAVPAPPASSAAPPPPPTETDPHAGHDMHGMKAMPIPEAAPNDKEGRIGTDLEPGNAPPPPVAGDRAADTYFGPAAMAEAQSALLGEHGGMKFHKVLFNIAEYQARNGRDGYRWDASAWFGGDIDRLALESEGEGNFGEASHHGELQALWSHAVDPYWNLQGGVRQDFGKGPDRTYATIGIEGLAPYWFEIETAAFVSTKGDVLARIKGEVDQRITQKWILQPRLEANFAAQDIPESGIGSGLSNLELGLRLRYELRKEFAPYVGVSWERKFGDTAHYARAAGENASSTSYVAGIRFWF
ncbi:copper resistance protein B [Sphingobium indicum]